MDWDPFDFDAPDDRWIRAERNKARELRKSRWWQQKTASGCCHYCGSKVAYRDLTMDHLVPLARGGRSTKQNLVPACKECNNLKKSMLPLEWEQYLDTRRQTGEGLGLTDAEQSVENGPDGQGQDGGALEGEGGSAGRSTGKGESNT